MALILRIPAVACVLSAILALVLCTISAGSAAAARTPDPRVEHSADRIYISDGQGREMLLRGINSNSLVDYPDNFRQTVPMTAGDVDEMAALGFNFLRLPISWSLLEPRPDRFSAGYLRRIRQIVRWARARGISTLIDFHQDRYNRHLRPPDEADGAPDWATDTKGEPCTPGAFLLSPCSIAAYDSFWNNEVLAGKPLQTHYLEAMIKVSRYLRGEPGMLGLEIMNEPLNGSTGSPGFERQQLWPFNNRMINGLRKAGEKRMIWFGPNMLRDGLDFDIGEPEKFSTDRNLVYSPHIYTGTFNSGGPAELEQSYANAGKEAKSYGAAWVDSEWGGGSDEKAESMRARNVELQDEYRVGSAFWMWKQKAGFYNWNTVNEDGSLRQDSMRAQMLSGPHPDRVPGQIRTTGLEDGNLEVTTQGPAGKIRLWSGTVIRRGGATLLERPLIRLFVDGRRTRPFLQARAFRTDRVSIRGFRVFARLPRGRHRIVLKPGTPRWVRGHRARRSAKGHGRRFRWVKGHWR